MLKWLAIAVLFAIVLPIHGQKESSKSGSDKNDGNSSQSPSGTPSRTASCVVKQEGTAIECQWPEDKPKSYFDRLRSPENLPNIGLFFVGLGGVIAAVFTLRAINRQAGHMETQVRIMNQQVGIAIEAGKTAQASAELAFEQLKATVAREMARLMVDPLPFYPTYIRYPPPFQISINVTHYGETAAFNVFGEGSGVISDSREFPQIPESKMWGISLPSIIEPTDEKPIKAEIWIIPPLSSDDGKRIDEETLFLHIVGKIAYQDYRNERLTVPFWFTWKAAFYSPGENVPVQDFSRWEVRIHPELKQEKIDSHSQNPN